MERLLIDRKSDKSWSIRWDDTVVYTRINNGKEKMKSFETEEAASKHAHKEMWSRLKKGFIVANAQAAVGEPVLHHYVPGGYTGFRPLANVPGRNLLFYCALIGDFEGEAFVLINPQGEKQQEARLPATPLTFDMQYCAATGKLLCNRDHQIVEVSGFEQLGLENSASAETNQVEAEQRSLSTTGRANTLAVSDHYAVWYDRSSLVVTDLRTDAVLFQKEVLYELYGGHSPQLSAAIASNGQSLAYCTNSEAIVLVDIPSGHERSITKPKPAMTEKMRFSPDGKLLFAQEMYGSWNLDAYVVESLLPVQSWEPCQIKSFAIDNERKLIATYFNKHIHLWDLTTMKLKTSFPVEHVVKSCSFTFTKDYLAVFTDYGCLSMYAI